MQIGLGVNGPAMAVSKTVATDSTKRSKRRAVPSIKGARSFSKKAARRRLGLRFKSVRFSRQAARSSARGGEKDKGTVNNVELKRNLTRLAQEGVVAGQFGDASRTTRWPAWILA